MKDKNGITLEVGDRVVFYRAGIKQIGKVIIIYINDDIDIWEQDNSQMHARNRIYRRHRTEIEIIK